MTAPRTLRLILGDQLDAGHAWFRSVDSSVVYVLMEIRQETDYVRHHLQKLLAFFSAMRAFAESLREKGHRVVYLRLDDPQNRQTIVANLAHLIETHHIARVAYQRPDEYRLDQNLSEMAAQLKVPVQVVDTEHFLTTRQELGKLFTGKKRFLMETFYRRMRTRHDILMEDGKPAGGKWNYDVRNRQRYDGAVPIPPAKRFANQVGDIRRMLNEQRVENFGSSTGGTLGWPITREQAMASLAHFLEHGLPHFGTYQDAMTADSESLFHSRLSFALNVKLIDPMEVIRAAVERWQAAPDRIGIAQVEGFVRQVLGWREYMRGVYWALMPGFAEMNALGHDGALPGFYWNGETRMRCLAHAIGQSLNSAYAHHIQRLMVTGNFALLAGVHPDAVDAWYLGVYIDAVEWVEMPNTRGMSQFADGGRIATKPYISSANYINKMSDYCATCAYDPKPRHGKKACPFNSLFWHFLHRHRRQLAGNPRLGAMYRVLDRLDEDERDKTLRQGDACLRRIDGL